VELLKIYFLDKINKIFMIDKLGNYLSIMNFFLFCRKKSKLGLLKQLVEILQKIICANQWTIYLKPKLQNGYCFLLR
jgi:hypothetical protein